ncbi:MAG: hypothetical protein JNJ75_17200 [Cyclobacteriaceae bacterium]|nr:hypothetical protein [Cyclobacteriaceae bacterium]
MEIKKKFIGFKSADRPSLGLALIFDISGFTMFYNKPDIHFYVTNYINHIVDCVDSTIWGGTAYYTEPPKEIDPLKLKPSMRKFLGDGMLYVWEDTDERFLSSPNLKINLINRLWNLQKYFSSINKKLLEEMPIGDLPKSVKFGIAQGTIYKLVEEDNTIDYIGPCINLASRLVKYCPEINFVASARLDLPKDKLEANRYFRIIAKELRSFENEIIIVDKNDYSKVSENDKKRLFTSL